MKTFTLTLIAFLGFSISCAKTQTANAIAQNNVTPQNHSFSFPEIEMLGPDDFPQLPKVMAEYLKKRGCRIPQLYKGMAPDEPHNVVQGSFYKKDRRDWAVLCSEKGASSILVFGNGTPGDLRELAKNPDDGYRQGDGQGTLGYSRLIVTVDKNYIRKRDEEFGKNAVAGTLPDGVEGIEDIFVEKASVIHYFRKGKWIELQGRD